MNISSGKLYSIKIERIVNKRLLFACGDDGVLVFDLEREVINRLKNSGKKVAKSTPLATFKPHPSPLEDKGIEINEIQILRNGDGKTYLFGAAGDSFGCYKWDLETKELIRTYSSPGRGYLCSIRVVPSPDEDEHNLLLLGGEDGVLTVWDLDQDKRLDHIDLNNASAADVALTESSSSNMPSKAPRRSNSKRSKTASNRWISSICARDRNWWTVAGGTTESLGGGPSGRGGGNSGRIGTGGGFVATFHAATRSMVAWSETREIPQKLASVPSNSTDFAVLSQHNLLSVANEGVVTHWDALTLDSNSKRRVWCSPPCAYAAAVSSDGLFTAVGGVGCYVDVFEQSGEKSMRLVL